MFMIIFTAAIDWFYLYNRSGRGPTEELEVTRPPENSSFSGTGL